MTARKPIEEFQTGVNGIAEELVRYQPRRTQRYKVVIVLLMYWKDDDLNCVDEIDSLEQLFSGSFGYDCVRYEIPSHNSHNELNVRIATFIHQNAFVDNLIIVYYGGHGGRTESRTPCIWAAKMAGGPTLDWSTIQPQLFSAGCDVAIILDCCYAGQAARPHTSYNVEFLAATDKDQMTPAGGQDWPSFTEVLIHELNEFIKEGHTATLPELHQRMVSSSLKTRRQPIYVALSGSSAGSIKLSKIHSSTPAKICFTRRTGSNESFPSLSLRLSLSHPLDSAARESLIKWMTRDSPHHIADIELVKQTIHDAGKAEYLGIELVRQPTGGSEMSSHLSSYGREEARRLLEALQETLSRSMSPQLTKPDVLQILEEIRENSQNLVTFVSDSLSHFDKSSLEGMKTNGLTGMQDMKDRIAMRLTLLTEDIPAENTTVEFTDLPVANQRFRRGKNNGVPVLVEYYYPATTNDQAQTSVLRQVSRTSTLHSEPKSPNFRTLLGLGFVTDSSDPPRFGVIYQLPENRAGCAYLSLSELLEKLKSVPLEIRARTAAALCEALLCLHSIGWYHKGIQCNNVLIFAVNPKVNPHRNNQSYTDWDLASPYLVGFDCSRPFEEETVGIAKFVADDNIYRHPERQDRTIRFERYHDLYALGILLTEIGCWKTPYKMDRKHSNFNHLKTPEELQKFFLLAADKKVSHAAGSGYAKGVTLCLKSKEWKDYEGWQFQKKAREGILQPIVHLASLEIKPRTLNAL